MGTDAQIEQEIQDKGLTAPRVTPADIESEIASEHYVNVGGSLEVSGTHLAITSPLHLLTICVLVLHNGFTVTGESACASPANFDAEIGHKIARQNAIAKLWPFLGFRLRDQLAKGVLTDADATADLAGAPRPSMLDASIERRARAAHEINRAYCEALGDTSQLPWDQAPEWQRASARAGVMHADRGATPEQLHERWCEAKSEEGWRYGPVKDADAKTHPCLLPYHKLPPEQRVKDHLFRAAVSL